MAPQPWYNINEVKEMSECMDGEWEVLQIEKEHAKYPSTEDITNMCLSLGVQEDEMRTVKLDDAWAYYHELKAQVEAKQRKTA